MISRNPGGSIHIVLAFPNTYHVGMSNLGFQTAYRLFNDIPFVTCERVFYPDPEIRAKCRSGRAQLLSMESSRPLTDFHLIAFSVSFENDYPAILEMLHWAGLSVRSADRHETDPLVAAGGVAVLLNPEPLADFMDFFFIGEAEGLVNPFVRHWIDAQGASRREILEYLAEHCPGLYVPRLYTPVYGSTGVLQSIQPKGKVPTRVRAVKVGLDSIEPAHSVLVTKETEFSETALIEIGRGCGRGCRFCAAGFIYRPPRFHTLEAISRLVAEWMPHTARIGLVSPAVSDYPELNELCHRLLDWNLQVHFSSLRADKVSPDILMALGESGLKAVAIAPEAGSERLRAVIGKHLTDENVLSAAERLTACGVQHLKLYFMIGLPLETREDLAATVDLVKRVKHRVLERSRGQKKLGEITLSVHSFVPKPFTPFQWAPFAGVSELKAKAKWLKHALGKVANVRVHFDLPKWAYVQAMLSRGDRRVGDLLEKVALKGMSWTQVARESVLNPDFWVMRERDPDEVFPWEIVDHGVKRAFLRSQYERAMRGLASEPCVQEPGCHICGACGRAHAEGPS
ncbi:radical SAM protein [Desulfosoma caldarium]|uniref:radical SAM protein n=1 Tax=Desulfosoma caldarium TaxID=610254 RepID=UPI001B85F8C5|nr:radical SAM protein [Desulfosoma caldarium]